MKNSEKLFVYGTLKTGIGPTYSIRGQMYDLGAFPGVVGISGGSGRVEGEIRHVSADQLKRFDVYEGVDSGLYRRIKTETLDGQEVWVYEFACDVGQHRKVPEGVW